MNFIQGLGEDAFIGLSSLETLNLAQNQIGHIHENAFAPLVNMKTLNLASNHITQLPTVGLGNLLTLKIFHNPELREFPPKDHFPSITRFYLAYAYHCCDYLSVVREAQDSFEVDEHIQFHDNMPHGVWESHSNATHKIMDNLTLDHDHYDDWSELSPAFSPQAMVVPDTEGWHPQGAVQLPVQVPVQVPAHEIAETSSKGTHVANVLYPEPSNNAQHYQYMLERPSILCRPKPGPFMPCDDLFGFWSLRCGVWFVFMLALVGNGVVFFVSVTSKSKMDVTRFLICNLAAADFFMGVYLGILAVVDAYTLGSFKQHAIQWQMSVGCIIAGFLGVLSSELSVFTLTVITLERFYAITHAIQLNKRLSLRHASVIMAGGWLWSISLATLPIFGISDYRKFAVCLPFEIEDVISKTYVCFIMVFNGLSFFVILTCYLIMYISIRHSQAWNSNDTRVAKRMALLVFTDFMCWAPIAFLSLCAAFGRNLIHFNEAKVLTIFVLPLNSCANPFLYAIFTKQFKKDCVLLCRRLESSSVARHFSQVSPSHLSMSWKCHRRPSGLRSLMGEGKSNSRNNSNSHSYGLVNNNSELSSGIHKETSKPYKEINGKGDSYLNLPNNLPNHYHHYHHCNNYITLPTKRCASSSCLHGNNNINTNNSHHHQESKVNGCSNNYNSNGYTIIRCANGKEAEALEMNVYCPKPSTKFCCCLSQGGLCSSCDCMVGGEGLFKATRYKQENSNGKVNKPQQVFLQHDCCFHSCGAETGGATTETYISNDGVDDRVHHFNQHHQHQHQQHHPNNCCLNKEWEPRCVAHNTNGATTTATTPSLCCGVKCGLPPQENDYTIAGSGLPNQLQLQSTSEKQVDKHVCKPNPTQQEPTENLHLHHHHHYKSLKNDDVKASKESSSSNKKVRPPSITVDSGEAGKCVETLYCPTGDYGDTPPLRQKFRVHPAGYVPVRTHDCGDDETCFNNDGSDNDDDNDDDVWQTTTKLNDLRRVV